jgi:hypothetical protein
VVLFLQGAWAWCQWPSQWFKMCSLVSCWLQYFTEPSLNQM